METAGTPASTFSLALFQSAQNHLPLPYTRRTPRFSSLRGEKARKQPERSTFSPASFQSAQNHPPLPILAERHAFPLFAEKSAKTVGTLNVLPRIVPIHAEPPPSPILAERHAFPLFVEKKRENSRNAQRSPPPRSNPRRTSAVPHTRRTPRFSSLRGEKRESSRNASFNVLLAAFQSTQNHPPFPATALSDLP